MRGQGVCLDWLDTDSIEIYWCGLHNDGLQRCQANGLHEEWCETGANKLMANHNE